MNARPILIVAATRMELEGLRSLCSPQQFPNLDIQWQVTGVGMVSTAMHLAMALQGRNSGCIALNVGVAGTFDLSLAIGSVVQVSDDRIAYFGAEDHDTFIGAEEIGLCAVEDVELHATLVTAHLPKVRGITVNAAHGNAGSIQRTMDRYAPQVESMEGAAFFHVCRHFGVSAMQIRAISNRVEPRDRAAWNLPLALHNLAQAMLLVLNELNDGN